MNEALVKNWNEKISDEDKVYCVGDLSLGKIEDSIEYVKKLKGHITLVIGNHDTDNRIKYYEECPNIEKITYADRFKYKKRCYWISHYPTITSNPGKEKPVWCISGHTHNKEKFDDNYIFNYNVNVDAHNMYPVALEQIHREISEHNRRVDPIKEFENIVNNLKITLYKNN